MLTNVKTMGVHPMLIAKIPQEASDAHAKRDSVEMETFALMSTNVKCLTHVDHKDQDVSILPVHTDVSVNKDTEVMGSHVFLNSSLQTKPENSLNLVRPVPLTMVATVLKNSMVPWVNTALMVNSMVQIDSNMVKVITTVMFSMVWEIMITLLDGTLTTLLILV